MFEVHHTVNKDFDSHHFEKCLQNFYRTNYKLLIQKVSYNHTPLNTTITFALSEIHRGI